MVKETKSVRVSIPVYNWLEDLKFKHRCAGVDEVLQQIKDGKIKLEN